MFGFRKKKKYNGLIDVKLNNEYQIDTRNNPYFPNLSDYLHYLDRAWKNKMNEDEGALYISTLYLCGILDLGLNKEADELYSRMKRIVDFGLSIGSIQHEGWNVFKTQIIDSAIDYQKKGLIDSKYLDNYYSFFDFTTDNSPITINELLFQSESGMDLSYIPNLDQVREIFALLNDNFTGAAQLSLFYRLVAFSYLESYKISQRNGKVFEVLNVKWLTSLIERSSEYSNSAIDHLKLEKITTDINYDIVESFKWFGVYG